MSARRKNESASVRAKRLAYARSYYLMRKNTESEEVRARRLAYNRSYNARRNESPEAKVKRLAKNRVRSLAWAAAHREEAKGYQAAYRLVPENQAKIKARQKVYHSLNREKISTAERQRRLSTKKSRVCLGYYGHVCKVVIPREARSNKRYCDDCVIKVMRGWRDEASYDAMRISAAAHYKKHAEARKAYAKVYKKKWEKENPERYKANRRAEYLRRKSRNRANLNTGDED